MGARDGPALVTSAHIPTEPYFEGRFLDGKLTWVYPQGTPGPGYAVGHDGVLWRNGERVGYVLKVEFNREALGHWVYYRSWRGSPMDHREWEP